MSTLLNPCPEILIKHAIVAVAALLMLAACETPQPAPKEGCAECEKMAMEANAAHKAKMAGEHKKDCACCKGKMAH